MADGQKLKESFCLLLWRHNGGQVTDDLKRIRKDLDLAGDPVERYVRGYCTEPVDCFGCPTMQEELAQHPPNEVLWVCPSCAGVVAKAAKAAGIAYTMPGHFTEGQCQYKHCDRPSFVEDGEVHPVGFSRYLQVVFGPINNS